MPNNYRNSHIEYSTSFKEGVKISHSMLTAKRIDKLPASQIPVQTITKQSLLKDHSHTPIEQTLVYRLAHSSLLLRLQGEYILIDPVFSLCASPVQWAGPKRYHDVPLQIDDLPQLRTLLISHDHYDHLDKHTILALDTKVDEYVMPSGVGGHLHPWGVAESKITELAWWETTQIGGTQFTATPSQHFSGRSLNDRNRTLWASFVLQGLHDKVFFSGDSGYFPGFKEIGQEFAGFDLTFIETGAYNKMWQDIHMLPEQSVQAHIDLQGKLMMPIHNSTFDLAQHAWYEPLERALVAAEEQQVNLVTPIIGSLFNLSRPGSNPLWWRCPKMSPNLSLAFS